MKNKFTKKAEDFPNQYDITFRPEFQTLNWVNVEVNDLQDLLDCYHRVQGGIRIQAMKWNALWFSEGEPHNATLIFDDKED